MQKNTLFSQVHVEHSATDHILDYKSSLSKFKKIEIISSIFFDQNAMSRYQLQSKALSRVFSDTTVQKHRFFGTQLSS